MNNQITDLREVFVPGEGATYQIGTDQYPQTVLKVTAKTVTVREDRAVVESGSDFTGDAVYSFSPNPAGRVETFRLGNDGAVRGKGRVGRLSPGRAAYRDPSF
jgi:hypothetical protein